MAERDLIDRYVASLGRSLAGTRGRRDALDEVEDHLRETAERLSCAGLSWQVAQATTIARFGEPAAVARALAGTASGGVALPSAFTRWAGFTAFVGAGLWAVAAVGAWWQSDAFAPWTVGRYDAWTQVTLVAALASTVVLLGLHARAGHRDLLAVGSVLLIGAATLAVGATTWAWPFWGAGMAVAFLVAVSRLDAALATPARWTRMLVAAWPVGTAVAFGLAALRVGPTDSYDTYYVSHLIGFAVGAALMAAGLIAAGRRLTAERPAAPEPTVVRVLSA